MTQEAGVPRDLFGKLRKLWLKDIADQARSGASRNTTVSGGQGLTISGGGDLTVDGGTFVAKYPADEGGGAAFVVGDQYVGGTYVGTGWLSQAPDGTDMIVARQDVDFGKTRVDIFGSDGRIILGNDAHTGQGMARPWLDYTPRLVRYADWRTFTLAATDVWETIYEYTIVKQLPRLEVCVYASMDTAATTGEMRVMVDGEQLDATEALTYAQGPNFFGPLHVAGDHMATLSVEVQVKRTTATGAVKADPAYCRGRQS